MIEKYINKYNKLNKYNQLKINILIRKILIYLSLSLKVTFIDVEKLYMIFKFLEIKKFKKAQFPV